MTSYGNEKGGPHEPPFAFAGEIPAYFFIIMATRLRSFGP